MKNLFILLIIAVTALMTSCFRSDIRVMEIHVPKMNGPECAEIVKKALNSVDGVKNVDIDLEKRVAVVTYHRLNVADRNLELVVTAAGFDANHSLTTADSQKNLPDDCK